MALVSVLPVFAAPAPPQVYSLTLASGDPKGVYFRLAQGIKAVAHNARIEIEVLPSEGSKQNLAWLAEGRADLALTQSDVASDAYGGRAGFARPLTRFRVIAPLYTEAVHILIHKPLYIHRLEDLRGKRVAVGPAGSGTETNAAQLLAASGLTLAEVDARHMSIEAAVAALRQGQLDAAFVTGAVPFPAVKDVLADGSASLFEPDRDLLERLRETCPFFLNTNIEQTDYPHLSEQVTTAGVQALLVGRSNLPKDAVERLVLALSESPELRKKFRLTEAPEVTSGVAVPSFEVVRQRDGWFGPILRQAKALWVPAAILLGFFLLGFVLRRELPFLRRRKEFLRFGIYLLTIWMAGSLVLFWVEHRVNANYVSVAASLWSGLITIFSLSNKEPLTLPGRVAGVILFIFGVGGFTWLGEKLISVYVRDHFLPLLRGGIAGFHKMKNHYVIVGWNEKAGGIIKQLLAEDLEDQKKVLILAAEGQTKDYIRSSGKVYIENGEQTDEKALLRVYVQTARSVIVLANSTDLATDARTILTLLAIRKICKVTGAPQISIIAEILDPRNVDLARFAGAEMDGDIEIVSSDQLGQGLLSHAAVHPGLLEVHRELLSFRKGHSEIHRIEIKKGFPEGIRFESLLATAMEKKIPVLPIALERKSNVFINPTEGVGVPENPDGHWPLLEGDRVFAICDSPRELTELLKHVHALAPAEATPGWKRRLRGRLIALALSLDKKPRKQAVGTPALPGTGEGATQAAEPPRATAG